MYTNILLHCGHLNKFPIRLLILYVSFAPHFYTKRARKKLDRESLTYFFHVSFVCTRTIEKSRFNLYLVGNFIDIFTRPMNNLRAIFAILRLPCSLLRQFQPLNGSSTKNTKNRIPYLMSTISLTYTKLVNVFGQ